MSNTDDNSLFPSAVRTAINLTSLNLVDDHLGANTKRTFTLFTIFGNVLGVLFRGRSRFCDLVRMGAAR